MKTTFSIGENLSTVRRVRVRRGAGGGRRGGLERLEIRTLLSVAVATSGKTAMYTDVDGDLVTVAVSVGTLTGANFTAAAAGLGDQLQVIDLSAGGFAGANVTVSAKAAGGGDGKVNVGYINSAGHDLGNVTVVGDLGRIDAGDGVATTAAVKKLSVQSMGLAGLESQGGSGDLQSDFVGALTSFVAVGEVKDVFLNVTGGVNGKIGTIDIGLLTGGAAIHSGAIAAEGDITQVKVKTHITGGVGVLSGSVVSSAGKIGNVTIGGSLIGGSANGAGMISSVTNIGAVTVGGSLLGGSASSTGSIFSDGDMGQVKITGNLQGDAGANSGSVASRFGKVAGATVGGDVTGGGGLQSANIFSGTTMGAVKITGDVRGGAGVSSGLIYAMGKLASLTIGGSVIGGGGENSGLVGSNVDAGAVFDYCRREHRHRDARTQRRDCRRE